MKQTKYIISIFFICASFILAGCKNSVSESPKVQDVKGCTISGSINLNMDAYPSESGTLNNARMATAGTGNSFFINCPDSTLTAVHSATGYTIQGSIFELSSSNYTYKVVLPSSGTWLLKLNAKAGETTYYGEANIYVDYYIGADGAKLEIWDPAPTIVISPVFKQGETGEIELKVMSEYQNSEWDGKAFTVKMIWSSNENEPGVAPSSILEDPTKIEMTKTVDSYYPGCKTPAFTYSNVPAGAYIVTFQFFDYTGLLVYECEQWIHVFGGMTTNTWRGNSEITSLGIHYREQSSVTYLTLTNDAVDFYRQAHATVSYPQKTVLYSKNTDKSGYSVQLVNNNDFENPSDSITIEQTYAAQCLSDVFCYGEGNAIYIAGTARTSIGQFNEIVYKVESSVATPYFKTIENVAIEGGEATVTSLYYDNVSQTVYGLTKGVSGSGYYFPCFFEYNQYSNQGVADYIDGNIMLHQSPKAFVVKDDLLYIPDYYNGKLELKCYYIDEYSAVFNELFTKSKTITTLGINHSIEITDMICIGDDIYILVDDFYNDLYKFYCRGTVIKYNISSQTCEEILAMATDDLYENVDSSIYFLTSAESDRYNPLYEDANHTKPYHMTFYCPEYYSPENINSSYFFGPQKILSYDDSYIYIADSGYLYVLTDYSQGMGFNDKTISYEPVNRIVKLDIENMDTTILVPNASSLFMYNQAIMLPGFDDTNNDEPNSYTSSGAQYPANTDKYPCILQN